MVFSRGLPPLENPASRDKSRRLIRNCSPTSERLSALPSGLRPDKLPLRFASRRLPDRSCYFIGNSFFSAAKVDLSVTS